MSKLVEQTTHNVIGYSTVTGKKIWDIENATSTHYDSLKLLHNKGYAIQGNQEFRINLKTGLFKL